MRLTHVDDVMGTRKFHAPIVPVKKVGNHVKLAMGGKRLYVPFAMVKGGHND